MLLLFDKKKKKRMAVITISTHYLLSTNKLRLQLQSDWMTLNYVTKDLLNIKRR